MKKWAFYSDYDSRVWQFTGCEFDNYRHVDNGKERYTWGYLSERQKEKAFMTDGDPEPGYGYVMLKGGKVRQINL